MFSRVFSPNRSALGLVFLALLPSACTPDGPVVRARSMAAILAEKLPIVPNKRPRQASEGRRMKDAPVYIDGRRVGVLRPLEIPSVLKPRMRKGSVPAPRYSIAEYIEATGGNLSKVRAVHLIGGRGRVAVLSGAEVNKHREDLLFLFTSGTRGKPRIGWPPGGIVVNSSIDIVQAVAVYQDKEPPQFNDKKGILHFGDNVPIEGIPYAPNEELKGTRFYYDGSLKGWMKRKTLPNSVLLPGADLASGLFSFSAFIEQLGIDPRKVKAVELVQDDDAVTRLDGRMLVQNPPLAFKLPRRNQGNLVLLLPKSTFPKAPDNLPETLPVRVSAVQLFFSQPPPTRSYANVADLLEPADAKSNNSGDGSGTDQGDP
ncbi:MAG: hypothetical protein IPK82_09170 [Polyangiaceae bacterium]|nr:hypothetical protein [Polyangiaceae bacterium]